MSAFKAAIDGLDGLRMSVAAVDRPHRPEIELRLRKVDGRLKGESLMGLTLRQARALRAALDSAIAAAADPLSAHDRDAPLQDDAREASARSADHDRLSSQADA